MRRYSEETDSMEIVNHHPLDSRSDIWSLGKAFAEILCTDPAVEDFQEQVESLPLPREIRTLIRLSNTGLISYQ
jgi:hypothetical protein